MLLRESYCTHVHKCSSVFTMLQIKTACSLSKKPQAAALEFISHQTSWFRDLSAILCLSIRGSKCWVMRGHKLPEEGAFLQGVLEMEPLLRGCAAEWGAASQCPQELPGTPEAVGTSLGKLGDISEWDLARLHLLFMRCASYNWEECFGQELLAYLKDQNLWLHQWFSHVFSVFYSYWSLFSFGEVLKVIRESICFKNICEHDVSHI